MAQTSVLIRPTNSPVIATKHTVTTAENYTAAVPEVLNLSITAGATADGNVSVTLRGATPVVIAVANLDAAGDVATKIAAGTFPGWTPLVVSTTHVQFTATVAGVKTGSNTFGVASTGVTGTFSVTTSGADQIGGDILFNAAKDGVGSLRYPLVATVTVRASNGTIASVTGLTLTYPSTNGQVRLQGQFATGQIIDFIAVETADGLTYSA